MGELTSKPPLLAKHARSGAPIYPIFFSILFSLLRSLTTQQLGCPSIVKILRGNFLKINVKPWVGVMASELGMDYQPDIFDEEYRVVAVESQSLTIQGVRSGQVLTIVTQNPGIPLTAADYRPGQLIALSDPSRRPVN